MVYHRACWFTFLVVPSRLPQHLHHLHLENGVYSFDTDTSTALWHRKYIDHANCKVIDEFSQHQTHDFHGHACAAMTQHLQEGEGRDVDGFGIIDQIGIVL